MKYYIYFVFIITFIFLTFNCVLFLMSYSRDWITSAYITFFHFFFFTDYLMKICSNLLI